MPRGPLPEANSRRRNPPTIKATTLPAEGRRGEPPEPPYRLGEAGRAWWEWAWRLPQAAAWDDGSTYFVARRARLEDDLAAIDRTDDLELDDLLAGADKEAVERVQYALGALVRVASGSTTLMREMRELENRLGLNPKAMADLRWTISEPVEPDGADAGGDVARMDDYRARLG
jgi:hypothetical protein